MSNAAWCDLNSKGDILNLHDLCHKPLWKCQKQFTFTPSQFQLKGAGLKDTMKQQYSEGLKKCGIISLKLDWKQLLWTFQLVL